MDTWKNKKLWIGSGLACIVVMMIIFGTMTGSNKANPFFESDKLHATNVKNEKDNKEEKQTKDVQARWKDEKWEYSTDGGKTWSDQAPEGIEVDENNNLKAWDDEGSMEDFDYEEYMKELNEEIDKIIEDTNEKYKDLMPEDGKNGSFFTVGDSIARQVDGVWEFSNDNGKTWTKEPPKGVEISEDGSRLQINKEIPKEEKQENTKAL